MTAVAADQLLTAAAARELTDDIRRDLSVTYSKITAAFAGRAWEALGYVSWHSYCAGEFAEARMLRMDPVQRAEISVDMRQSGMSTRAIGSALGIGKSTVDRDIASVPDGTDEPATVISLDGRGRPATQPSRIAAPVDHVRAKADAAIIATFDPEPGTDEPNPLTDPLDADADDEPVEAVQARFDAGPHVVSAPPAPGQPNRKPLVDTWRIAVIEAERIAERIGRLTDDDRFTRNAEQLAAVSRHELSHSVELLSKALDLLPTRKATP